MGAAWDQDTVVVEGWDADMAEDMAVAEDADGGDKHYVRTYCHA
jgi:hypothetical protein